MILSGLSLDFSWSILELSQNYSSIFPSSNLDYSWFYLSSIKAEESKLLLFETCWSYGGRGPQNICCLVSNVFTGEFVLWNAELLLSRNGTKKLIWNGIHYIRHKTDHLIQYTRHLISKPGSIVLLKGHFTHNTFKSNIFMLIS